MPALGITGGVATGKSSFSAALRRHLPATFFDADRCAHELLASDAGVQKAVAEAFGQDVISLDGRPDRGRLREIVFANSARRRQLEQILHPIIRDRWMEEAENAARSDHWFCADIPLLYETNAQSHFAAVIVVACSPVTQRARLRDQRQLPNDIAENIIASQLDLTTKVAQADYLIWNDSSESCLDRQSRLLAGALQRRFHG
ncbi:dephospho-CoA kinase [Chthoniobacter flavus]|uniref:dephospho-CoA kinase n=1 Tax=Chthoniobacter flavus TaxID=191863 RepID=UPI000A00EE53|nr:dephospho-CoA kinase [Chthoniobacter flavus]